MTAIAIYARYSSDNQREASIEDQIRLCEEHAAREGWQVYKTYSDSAISGASLLRRGLQALLEDALAGKFTIVLAEALDRLSRDQADTAALFKQLHFAGVQIVTLSEGPVSELHVGLKGTMNALYLKDLAEKTRRGLRGRVEAGMSGGGNSYGYDVVKRIGKDGEPLRGERRINDKEAAIVRRIFTEYTQGKSPRAMAKQLNREGVPGPYGKAWGPSTIHGNQKRGTGILNNELYIGRLVWNRLRYIKDPQTGRRVSRLNPESQWIIKDVPELRNIDQALWDQVKARQASVDGSKFGEANKGHIDRRLPRHLLSGLMSCGVCGGSVTSLNKTYVGCPTAHNKGMCRNSRTLRREVLEELVTRALQSELMDPALLEEFCAEYTREMNRLRRDQNAALEGARSELAKVSRDLDRLVQALLDGIDAKTVRDKMAQLEARKAELELKLATMTEEPVRLHPNMAQRYRDEVAGMREALMDPEGRAEAADFMRRLIEKIELAPVKKAGKEVIAVNLYGHLAGILNLAAKKKAPPAKGSACFESVAMVAGARNQLQVAVGLVADLGRSRGRDLNGTCDFSLQRHQGIFERLRATVFHSENQGSVATGGRSIDTASASLPRAISQPNPAQVDPMPKAPTTELSTGPDSVHRPTGLLRVRPTSPSLLQEQR